MSQAGRGQNRAKGLEIGKDMMPSNKIAPFLILWSRMNETTPYDALLKKVGISGGTIPNARKGSLSRDNAIKIKHAYDKWKEHQPEVEI